MGLLVVERVRGSSVEQCQDESVSSLGLLTACEAANSGRQQERHGQLPRVEFLRIAGKIRVRFIPHTWQSWPAVSRPFRELHNVISYAIPQRIGLRV